MRNQAPAQWIEDVDPSLLEHVSPVEWQNVILYGQYVLNPNDIR